MPLRSLGAAVSDRAHSSAWIFIKSPLSARGWDSSITASHVSLLVCGKTLLKALGLDSKAFHLLLQGGPGGWLNICSAELILDVG